MKVDYCHTFQSSLDWASSHQVAVVEVAAFAVVEEEEH